MTLVKRAKIVYYWERFKAHCNNLFLTLIVIVLFPFFVIMACIICTDKEEE